MLLHYTISHLSRYCWSLLILAWFFARALDTSTSYLSQKSKTGCATPRAYRTRTTSHLLGCACTFLASFLLQLEAFLHPPLQMEKMALCPRQGTPHAGPAAPLLPSSLPASSPQHHCHIHHRSMHANRKYNRLTHLFPLVIDDLSRLS